MPKSFTKVVYKPDPQSTDEYMVVVDPSEFKKWKLGDKSIPLANIVDSFEVFYSSQGSQGHLGRPSKQQLENAFGKFRDVDVVQLLLEKGKEQPSEGILSQGTYNINATRGSAVLDSRGKGLTGI